MSPEPYILTMDEKQSMQRMMEGVKMASAAARQVAHQRMDQRWLVISEALDVMHKHITQLSVAAALGLHPTH